MRKFLTLLLLLLCFSFVGCEDVTPEKVEPTTKPVDATVLTPEVTEAPKTEVFKIGDIVKAGDVYFKVNSVKEIAPSSDFIKPKDGHIWYAVDITVENKSNAAVQMSSLMMFKLVDSEGYSYDLTIGPEVKGSLDGELGAGRKMSGEIPFEIPKDSKELELEIDPTLFGNGIIVVKLDR